MVYLKYQKGNAKLELASTNTVGIAWAEQEGFVLVGGVKPVEEKALSLGSTDAPKTEEKSESGVSEETPPKKKKVGHKQLIKLMEEAETLEDLDAVYNNDTRVTVTTKYNILKKKFESKD